MGKETEEKVPDETAVAQRRLVRAGDTVYVNFATGILEGNVIGWKGELIEVETREWCGDAYYRVTRAHPPERVHHNLEAASDRAAVNLANIMCGFSCETVAAAVKIYMSRPDCSEVARKKILSPNALGQPPATGSAATNHHQTE